jgi:CYTH domain-containing protein
MSDASWLREPGRGKYARLEREPRVVLAALPDGLGPARHIEDRYLDGTSLRVRRMSDDDGAVVHKLTQKVRRDADDPSVVAITNVYLTAEEFALLGGLPGQSLRKVRRAGSWGGRTWAVDEILGRWQGLVLAELELGDDETSPSSLPDGLDVTHDDRFSGGALAGASDDEAGELLAFVRAAVRGASG